AGSIEELGLQSADEMFVDIDALLGNRSESNAAADSNLAAEADLDQMLGTGAAVATATKATDEWFCIIGGAELGPMSFEELTGYAQNEQLSADDEVKLGATGKWRRVGSIGRLMAVMPYQAPKKS